MNFDEFTKKVVGMAEEVKKAQGLAIPQKIESAALRFVDDNFRNQSWEGQAWEPSKGTILVKSGALRRGFESSVSTGEVRIYNEVKYAKAHNEGFDGEISVPEHERGQYEKVGSGVFTKKGKERLITKKKGSGRVKAHKKHLKLPKRQFSPTEASPSKTLNNTINTIISSEMIKILQP